MKKCQHRKITVTPFSKSSMVTRCCNSNLAMELMIKCDKCKKHTHLEQGKVIKNKEEFIKLIEGGKDEN